MLAIKSKIQRKRWVFTRILVEKMFVSRQTISNWENDKSYPDIHNLLIMCQLFKISLDE